MIHVPHFTFPLISNSFSSNYKHAFQGWDHHKWVGMCLVDIFVCRWRVYLKLSKTRWRKPLQMEDTTCITSCAVITHRATINPFERLCSPVLQKESPRIWKEISHYYWVNDASSVKRPPFCWNLNMAHLRWVGPFQTRASLSPIWLSTQQNNLQRKSKNVAFWQRNLCRSQL